MSKLAVPSNARMKIQRANEHIDALIEDSSPLSKRLYEVVNGPRHSSFGGVEQDGFALTYQPKKPLAQHFGAIIGDAMNNLREALDYWINASVEAFAGQPRKVSFPFNDEWECLESTTNYKALSKAFPDLASYILREIKPSRNANLDIWAITSLCNQNKHNDFIPVINVASINNVNVRTSGVTMKNCVVRGNADFPINVIVSNAPIAIEDNFSVSVDVTFTPEAVFGNEAVASRLVSLSKVASQTLDALDHFISNRSAI